MSNDVKLQEDFLQPLIVLIDLNMIGCLSNKQASEDLPKSTRSGSSENIGSLKRFANTHF